MPWALWGRFSWWVENRRSSQSPRMARSMPQVRGYSIWSTYRSITWIRRTYDIYSIHEVAHKVYNGRSRGLVHNFPITIFVLIFCEVHNLTFHFDANWIWSDLRLNSWSESLIILLLIRYLINSVFLTKMLPGRNGESSLTVKWNC